MTVYSRPKGTADGTSTPRDNGLELLKHIGDLETAGVYQNYLGLNMRDEFAGGHRGIIDIRV
jgi:hypothetical protein